jgi:nucleotide-binding universal stress UspA family protein
MQTPRSILLHLDGSARTVERIRVARELADTFGAEVTGLPCTLSALMRYPYAIDGATEAVAIMQRLDKDDCDKMRAEFSVHSAGSQRMHWAEPERDGPWGFARRALCADLMILGQRDRNDPMDSELPPDFLPSTLVESGRPALVLPYAGPVRPIGRNVLVAWKETSESARALTAALPWLRRAEQVHVVAYGRDAAASLERLRHYLQVQGIRQTTLHDGGEKADDIGNRLLSRAADQGADLLVMGCYGHSRAREWVLGGATRSMLESMTLPVLMSH